MPDPYEDTSFQDIRLVAMRRDPTIKPFSTMYTDIRCRQLEETFPGNCMEGVWPISAQRISRGWGSVSEEDWPNVGSDEWPGIEPEGLDAKAKANRIHHYQRVRTANDCRVLLAYEIPVPAAFEITAQWFDTPYGLIRMPREGDTIVGSHQVCIMGFDLIHQAFVFQNSWGGDWGVNGLGYLPFTYFDRYLVESWAMHGLRHRPDYFNFQGVDPVSWGVPDLLGHALHGGDILHGREVVDGTADEHMGWAFAAHRCGFLDIEELFVRPQYRSKGIGSQLVDMLLQLSADVQKPLRLWVPFADWTDAQLPRVQRISEKLGLTLFHSGVRWAPVVGLSDTSDTDAGKHLLPVNRAHNVPALIAPPIRARPRTTRWRPNA